ncbi:hypothetical protein HDU93_003384 [Gonapodya sp. JEL0774]|nr:hypothetical protein HDU93_003384 [Gonapodya sp. JEL0774]
MAQASTAPFSVSISGTVLADLVFLAGCLKGDFTGALFGNITSRRYRVFTDEASDGEWKEDTIVGITSRTPNVLRDFASKLTFEHAPAPTGCTPEVPFHKVARVFG